MEHSDWSLPLQTDRSERQSKMDPRARLLKLVIERIELKQIDRSFYVRSLPPDNSDFQLWFAIREFIYSTKSNRSSSDELDLACEIDTLDAWTVFMVVERVDKIDNLREVFSRALRSISHAKIPHAGRSSEYANISILYVFQHFYLTIVDSPLHSKQEYIHASEADSKLAIGYTLHAFLTSVLHLLTSVFQYLIGYVDRGGYKTYSSGAFDFRASFVSLVLFQGAYVWIKFRQAARPGSRKRKAPDVEHQVVDIETANLRGVYVRPIKEKSSGAITHFKYEPRFTPPRQEGDDGTDICSKRLPLGEYHTRVEAQIVLQIARYYYDKDGSCVELEDGRYKFLIPPMSEQERGLAGKGKRRWVTCTAKQVGKQVYADFQREKGKHSDMTTEAGSHASLIRVEFNDPSSSALPLASSSLPMLTSMAGEPAITSTTPSSPSLPALLPYDGAIVGDADDSCHEALYGFEDMLAELICDPGLSNLLDQQSNLVSYQMQYQGFPQLPEDDPSLPEVGAVAGASIEHDSEPELNHSPGFQEGRDLADADTENIDGRVLLPESVPDLQQLLLCQKKCLEDNARQFVDLDHQLKASQIQNSRLQHEYQSQISKLQQEKERLRSENVSLKSRSEQVVKSQVAILTGIVIDINKGNE